MPTWKKTCLTVVAMIALATSWFACGPQPSEAPPGTSPKLQGAVLIMIDTLRADHLSSYGYSRPTSPSIDALAARGVRFEQAITGAPWTLPAVSGLLAGEYAERVFRGKLTRSMVEELAAGGVVTGAVTEGGFVSRSFGMDLGFADYREETGPVQIVREGETGHAQGTTGGIENTFALARQWLANRKHEPFFLFVHTYEVHTPYTRHDFTAGMDPGQVGDIYATDGIVKRLKAGEAVLTPAEREYVTALYDGGVVTADRHIGALLSFLETSGLADKTMVVVVGDHGEELGEHFPSRIGDHGHTLHDSIVHVPIVLYDPTREHKIKTVSSQVRLIDVLPTIADALGVARTVPTEGHSLLPLVDGLDSTSRLALSGQTRFGPKRLAIRQLGLKFIAVVGPEPEAQPMLVKPPMKALYDLRSDPLEQHNLVDEQPEVAAAMELELQRHHRGLSAPVREDSTDTLDPEVLERLRSLGYVD